MHFHLVTGGAGFIGSHVVRALLEDGHRVRVLDNFSTGTEKNLPLDNERLEVIEGDIRNWKIVQESTQGAAGVVHLAAQASVPKSFEQPRISSEINMLGFVNLLDALRQECFTGKLIYASSSAVYGEPDEKKPLKEKEGYAPATSPYAFEKRQMEEFAALYNRLYGLQSLGLRFFNVYGPRQDASSSYSGVISIFTNRLSKGNSLDIIGTGEQVRDFIYAEDVAGLILKALRSSYNGVLNVGTGQSTDILQLAEIAADIYGVEPQISRQSDRPGDIQYSCADITRMKKELGRFEMTPLHDGLRKLKEHLESATPSSMAPARPAVETPPSSAWEETPTAPPEALEKLEKLERAEKPEQPEQLKKTEEEKMPPHEAPSLSSQKEPPAQKRKPAPAVYTTPPTRADEPEEEQEEAENEPVSPAPISEQPSYASPKAPPSRPMGPRRPV